jgi:hypothetical protein
MTEEIRDEEWDNFCANFSRMFDGSLVTIETIDSQNIRRQIAHNVPFEGLALDRSDQCNNVLTVRASDIGQRRLEQQVVEPIHMIVRRANGDSKTLEIMGEEGATLIHFHTGKWPAAFSPKQTLRAALTGAP